MIRKKLKRQQANGLSGRDLYTSYANLGTFLIHGSFKQAQTGDTAARARFSEGLDFIRKSVEVNPEAALRPRGMASKHCGVHTGRNG